MSHVWSPEINRRFMRLMLEAAPGFDVFFLLNTGPAEQAGADEDLDDPAWLIRVKWPELRSLPYPGKCRGQNWNMHGNADLLFLHIWRHKPGYERYWFVEYDVHFEGNWLVLFEYFASSPADVVGTIIFPAADNPNIVTVMQPPLRLPDDQAWSLGDVVKAFLPICRLSQVMLCRLDHEYRRGMVGHYELTVATVAALHGLAIEDLGGSGPYVRRANRHRFYFASPTTYTHSPGTFVFRPVIGRVLPRPNTLWHPVKPDNVPVWFPLHVRGGPLKNLVEAVKRIVWPMLIRLWFLVYWNPLPEAEVRASSRQTRPDPTAAGTHQTS